MKIKLVSIATEIGKKSIPIKEIAGRFGRKPEIITKKNGVTMLRAFGDDQDLIDVAVDVCRRVSKLCDGNIHGIFGTSNFTGPTLMPTFTATVAHKLGLRDVICDNVGLGCAGGIQALRNAYNQLMVDGIKGKIGYYIVVCGDRLDRIIDPTSLNTSVFFSDGCAALLLTNDPEFDDVGFEVEYVETTCLLNDAYDMLTISNPFATRGQPTPWLEMRGRKVYNFAEEVMLSVVKMVGSEEASLIKDGFLIPHQANARLIEQIIEKNNLNPDSVYSYGIKTIGNLLNASTFFGLEDVIRNWFIGLRFKNVYLLGFGAEQQIGIVSLKTSEANIVAP